ncbi:PepSY domain-containing protein, partial [Streptomyces sp. 150FB]|uniref:PepSY domain-containing protein n=1 Tax=Streptomyces sp. 150FB TaxID=1576605 RepID=UPI0012379C53
GVSAQRAAAAALAATPGSVVEIDLDDDGAAHWEVEVLGRDNARHELHVDARTAKVTADRDHHGDDNGDRHGKADDRDGRDDRGHDSDDDHGHDH